MNSDLMGIEIQRFQLREMVLPAFFGFLNLSNKLLAFLLCRQLCNGLLRNCGRVASVEVLSREACRP